MNHLIIVDMQNDFITGALANPRAEKIIPKIAEELKGARSAGYKIIYTVDTHGKDYLFTDEGKHLPIIHCVDGTWGQEIADEIKPLPGDTVFKKSSFAYDGWKSWINPGDTVTICGTLSEICVVANVAAIRAIPDVHIKILRDCCASLSDVAQEAAMRIMTALHCDIT